MKVMELVEFMNNSKNKMLNAAQKQDVLKKILEVKKYISIKEKKQLVQDIVDECILYDDGIYKFDEIDKYIYFTMKTLETYTNLELSDDIEDDYDALCQYGLLNAIVDTFTGEYENVSLLLQMKCDYILSDNNVGAQVGRFLNQILEKVDDFSGVLTEQLGNFDMSNLPLDAQSITKLLELVGNNK